jgi:hypothetical protein
LAVDSPWPGDFGDDERHVQGRFVGEEAVRALAVLAEARRDRR